jgi:hypothetical protein
MSGRYPTLVALYWLGTGGRTRVAEFRLNTAGAAELIVFDPSKSLGAQGYFDHGVDLAAESRTVYPSEGPAFLLALLQPFRTTYFAFVDESPREDAGHSLI